MLFYDVLCVCFVPLLASSFETNAEPGSKTVEPESLFADVIKNISRVNNELQNLINNYEQFKRTHDSQEMFNVKKEYISDADGGRINRNNNRKPSHKTTTNSYQTEIIYEEEEAEKNSGASEVEKSSQVQSSSEVEHSHEEESKKPIDKEKQKVQTTTTDTSVVNKEPTDESQQNEEPEPTSQDFASIHQDMKVKTDRLKRILSEAYQETNKTKYTENEKQTKYLDGNSPQPSDISEDDERHTEVKEEENKVKERAFDDRLTGGSTTGIYLRSELKEITITTKGPPRNIIVQRPLNESLESTDNDEDFSKDVFKTNVLREAYGDACIKLVIRKCYKACKTASVYSCRGAIKCKKELKNYFKDKAKTGCITAFNVSHLRGLPDPESVDGNIITREGYLSVACQTPSAERRNLEKPNSANNNTEQLNILRDKYEKACAKISQKKCISACNYAAEESCSKYECKKSLQKRYKRNCKRACKKYYYANKSQSTESDDDSDDDSYEDSDEDNYEDSDDDSDYDSDDDSNYDSDYDDDDGDES